ncbi:MAG: methylenetetrahydrofolate reductase [Gammaproteobacteria bacterium]|nr:methylenetetrahydrofolate reductase [Gammaproteobacteria bacterium]
MSALARALQTDQFLVTSELNPPKGVDLRGLYTKAAVLRDCVQAVNVTDSAGAHMALAPLAACHLLLDHGIEPILQLTSRDRNRIALQGDILGAAALGVCNLVVMGGDPPSNGDHPQAKPVFDLYASQIIAAAQALTEGRDLAGNALHGSPSLCIGAVVNPGAADPTDEIQRMREKIAAGATFMQTQAVYDADAFARFSEAAGGFEVPVLAGIIPLKSVGMARFLNDKVPGITVPQHIVGELDAARDKRAAAIDIAARTIRDVREFCRGVHIMAIGWEEIIPDILATVGVAGDS